MRFLQKLFESRLDFLRQKYGEAVKKKGPPEQDDFDLLIAADPTSRPNHAGNYSEWIIKNYLADTEGRFIEDLSKLTANLQLFDRFKSRLPVDQRDINKLTPVSLWKAGETIKQQKGDNTSSSQEIVNNEMSVLYKDNGVIAIRPLTWPASVKLGRGTNWCTAADSESGKGYFKYYNSSGYLVIFKFADNFRAQLEISDKSKRVQLMDVADQTIELTTLLSHYNGDSRKDYINFLANFMNVRTLAAELRSNKEHADVAKEFTTKIKDEPFETRLSLAKATNLSPEELQTLKNSSNEEAIHRTILFKQNVGDDELRAAINSNNLSKIMMAARNPNISKELMKSIVMGDSLPAKVGLYNNSSLPANFKTKLAKELDLS